MVNTFQKGIIIGIIITISIIIGIWITFLISDYLLKYSGITMFYSLIAVFVILVISENLKKKGKKEENEMLLRSIFRVTKQIEKHINYSWENLISNKVPTTNIGVFDVILPLEIRRKNTKRLDDFIIFANDKIDTINNWREGYFDILLEPNVKEREKLAKRYNEFWGDSAQIAFGELKKTIEDIRNELGKWIKIQE